MNVHDLLIRCPFLYPYLITNVSVDSIVVLKLGTCTLLVNQEFAHNLVLEQFQPAMDQYCGSPGSILSSVFRSLSKTVDRILRPNFLEKDDEGVSGE